jgi:transposase
MAAHYGAAVLPTWVRRPRDKAKVEVAVLIVERFILARLRNRRFLSLGELNEAIQEVLGDLNARLMRKLGASRWEFFEMLDRPALLPLPAEPYAYAEWRRCRVAPDYHVEVHGHFYSVPSRLIREVVEARITDTTIEVFHAGQRVVAHPRSAVKRRHTTTPEHMPSAHRRGACPRAGPWPDPWASWTPARMLSFAAQVGPGTAALVETIMRTKPHPEQGFRACLGILKLAKTYGDVRLEAACQRGLTIGARTYGSIASILKTGLDRAFHDATTPEAAPLLHANIRGRGYYH